MKSPRLRDLLAAGAAVLSVTATALVPAPAYAQFGFGGIVYDPSNYAQNVLTAARTLEQINNQIRQLQNQATSLINEARNLASLPTTMLEPLQQQIRQTQQLLAQAQRISFDVQQIETEFARQYSGHNLTGSQREMVQGAEERWKNSVAAFEDALKVQAGAVDRVGLDPLVGPVELRVRPDRDRRREAVPLHGEPAGVDPVGRDHRRAVRLQVRRGVAQLPTAVVPVHDDPLEAVGASQDPVRRLDLPFHEQ